MMPCWYFEKKEIKNSPSYLEGIDVNTEAKYRRDGARFIIDAGTKLGLRYDTCATGVVYFHRFYMFHSFKEFPRYVTAACCLFLAGKVEETPKKCKDIIKIATDILTPQQFAAFGNDPREEVMTLERILLKTVKFDFQVEHPYALLVKFAKNIKGDKEKVQKLVQMAWTFINDSLCTTLSLQWEPEIIAVSLMYLGTRLNKFDVHDWSGKLPGTKQKWWESFVEDLTVDLMEDVCHQVLDLYSPANQQRDSGESPPPPPPVIPPNAGRTPNSQGSGDRKRSLPSTPSDPNTPGSQSSKAMKIESVPHMKKTTPQKVPPDKGRQPPPTSRPNQPPLQGEKIQSVTGQKAAPSSGGASYSQPPLTSSVQSYPAQADTPQYSTADPAAFSGYNPYMSTNMYSSSFMSQEGSQTLQTVMGTQAPVSTTTPQYGAYSQTQPPPAPAGAPPYGVPGPTQYIQPGYQQQPGVYPTGTPGHPPPQGGPPTPAPTQPQYPPPGPQQQYPGATYPTYAQAAPGATAGYPNLAQPPPLMSQTYDQPAQPPNYHTTGAYPGPPRGPRPPHSQPPKQHQPTSALTTVRITGR